MWVGVALGVALRFLLYGAGATAYLEDHIFLNSPMTSHTRLAECLFLLGSGTSPYAGDTCHYPPLLLLLLSPLQHAPPLAHFALVVAVDLAAALLLRSMAVQYLAIRAQAGRPWAEASVQLREPSAAETPQALSADLEDLVSPAFVGLSYFLNPITVASCLSLSLQNVHHVALCSAVYLASGGSGGLAAAALAIANYVCPFTPVVMLLPCAYLAFTRREAPGPPVQEERYVRSKDTVLVDPGFPGYLLRFVAAVLLLSACLLGGSLAAMGGQKHFLDSCFRSVLAVRDLTPNVGIWWYLNIEVFDRYRVMFLMAFHAHIFFYPLPLHLRVGRHRPIGPWLQCAASIALVTLFRPYPTASDYGLMLSVMLIQVELIREGEKMFAFLMSGVLFGLCMFPVMVSVWLTRNAGNANFLYNMTLVINIFACLLLSEWLKAGMRLRRRQRLSAFCRETLLGALDKGLGEAKRPAPRAASPAPRAAAAANSGEGVRQRR